MGGTRKHTHRERRYSTVLTHLTFNFEIDAVFSVVYETKTTAEESGNSMVG